MWSTIKEMRDMLMNRDFEDDEVSSSDEMDEFDLVHLHFRTTNGYGSLQNNNTGVAKEVGAAKTSASCIDN